MFLQGLQRTGKKFDYRLDKKVVSVLEKFQHFFLPCKTGPRDSPTLPVYYAINDVDYRVKFYHLWEKNMPIKHRSDHVRAESVLCLYKYLHCQMKIQQA